MINEYEQQGINFLTSNNIQFKAILKADRCPLFCDGKHIHGDRYLVTFSKHQSDYVPRKRMSISFWNSLNDSQQGINPTAYDVITCLTKNNPGTFENFCSDFGYDTDSRQAYKTYKAVCKEWSKMENFFTQSELEQMQDIN